MLNVDIIIIESSKTAQAKHWICTTAAKAFIMQTNLSPSFELIWVRLLAIDPDMHIARPGSLWTVIMPNTSIVRGKYRKTPVEFCGNSPNDAVRQTWDMLNELFKEGIDLKQENLHQNQVHWNHQTGSWEDVSSEAPSDNVVALCGCGI